MPRIVQDSHATKHIAHSNTESMSPSRRILLEPIFSQPGEGNTVARGVMSDGTWRAKPELCILYCLGASLASTADSSPIEVRTTTSRENS